MRSVLIRLGYAAAVTALACAVAHAAPAQFQDPLDRPAAPTAMAANSPLLAVTVAGARLVAVGLRGVIVYSDDQGGSWRQAGSPVASDLTAVHFPTPRLGWAVGHDGVILHSSDGGASWIKQLDGRSAAAQFIDYYQRRVNDGDPSALDHANAQRANFRSGPGLPYLGVWFEDEQVGYAVGAFGMIAATRDGGKSWRPWLERIDNPQYRNLNTVRGIGGAVYVAGEQGAVFRLDRARQHFVFSGTAYKGSFFGITGSGRTLLAYGLRGAAYRSGDGGASWQPVEVQAGAAVSDADVSADGRRMLLVSAAGVVSLSDDGGMTFRRYAAVSPMLFTGVRLLPDQRAVFTGFQGTQVQAVR